MVLLQAVVMGLKSILLVLAAVQVCRASIVCYSCKNALDPIACNTTTICSDDQVCFHNSTKSGQIQVLNLGCADNQKCGVNGNIQSSIVGREIGTRNADSCFECCSTDQCNRHICDHLKPSACIDDESLDCARLSTLFSICSDIDHAKTVCPKFCGLCNVVDGNWSGWSSWSQCDVTCENGTQSRTRLCNNPAPKNGGHDCQGSYVTTKPCVRDVCPVDGGWSTWEAWKSCSTTCDMGLKSRTRNCSNPFPAHNGQHCFGHNLDVRQCLPGPCANGVWSEWGNWSPCTASCGSGIRATSRSCTRPPPSPYGQYCIGEHFKLESCAQPECDCEQPEGITHGSVYVPVTTHGATANYTCDVEYQVTAGDAVRTCTDGVWVGTTPVCSPIPNIGCYLAGLAKLFSGTRRNTTNGHNCQRWDSQTPHGHGNTNANMYPSGDVSANENYCRDPDNSGAPWCYTTDSNVRWAFCGITVC